MSFNQHSTFEINMLLAVITVLNENKIFVSTSSFINKNTRDFKVPVRPLLCSSIKISDKDDVFCLLLFFFNFQSFIYCYFLYSFLVKRVETF